ncbi:MAG: class II fumarate hydratase [Cellvibrionales bacterium]|nr:class II fumarate hydratase [Cellvibrionales bacterium]
MSEAPVSDDFFKPLPIDSGALWGQQTQRSLRYFSIGDQRFPKAFIEVLITIKKIAAEVNLAKAMLDAERAHAIVTACDQLLSGGYDDQFPLHVWQTGSGTQTNMNVNEVIASLANKQLESLGAAINVHPNDHVNCSQSSNDIFPTAMHVCLSHQIQRDLLPVLVGLIEDLESKAQEFTGFISVGRTHLMDALPMQSGCPFGAFAEDLSEVKGDIASGLERFYALAVGGTAIGSGANAPDGFGEAMASELSKVFELPFVSAKNLYTAVSSEKSTCFISGLLKSLAVCLFKLANDVRLMGSGPRCGFNEWILPANEPGSSIMPGKVNPTQCEALSMVCLQVFGNDVTVSMAASQGQCQLNTYRPLILHNLYESIDLLSDSIQNFSQFCLHGLLLNEQQMKQNLANNLSLVTLLASDIGYDAASAVAHYALENHCSLAEAAEAKGVDDKARFAKKMSEKLKEAVDAR